MTLHALRTHVLVLIATALHASVLVAAAGDGAYAPAESAAVARVEWQRRREARAAGDLIAAVIHARRAHAAWPGQWVYAYGLASSAAQAGDGQTARRALDDLEALGAAPNLEPDTTLVAFSLTKAGVEAGLPEALGRIAARSGRGVRSPPIFTFPDSDSTFWPEGIAYDSVRAEFYLAGVREGRVARVDRRGKVHPALQVASKGWSALAVGVDLPQGKLWVTAAALPQARGYDPADSGRAAILAFDLADGTLRSRFDLPPAPEGHVPGDVLVAPDGDVYVSDSAHPAIWRIHEGGLEVFARDPGFRSLQGQALSMDGRTLYVADYSHGIAAIDRGTRRVRWLPSPARSSVLGIDGLFGFGSFLFGVQNGLVPPRVVLIDLSVEGDRITNVRELARDPVDADEPTLLVRAGPDLVYVANSQWEKYDEDGTRRPGTRLGAPRVLKVPGLRFSFEPPREGSDGGPAFECGELR